MAQYTAYLWCRYSNAKMKKLVKYNDAYNGAF